MSQTHSHTRPAPLVNIAAIAVIIASLTAIAGVTGLIPSAFPQKGERAPATLATAAGGTETGEQSHLARADPAGASACKQCGVIESVRQVQVKGEGSGLGAVAGGVTGAIVGSQFGRGNGRTAIGVLGAAGGAYAGHQIEKNVRSTTSYRVTVRMDDGTARTVYQSTAPGFGVGEKVRVMNGSLVARG